mgnify:CR=1 FL=1
MGIISFSHSPMLSVLLAPVHAVAAWFVPAQSATSLFAVPAQAQRRPAQLALPFASESSSGRRRPANGQCVATKIGKNASRLPALNHLRVVREFDSSVNPACAGRMVISGRMADVCAELERMVQHERTHAERPQP